MAHAVDHTDHQMLDYVQQNIVISLPVYSKLGKLAINSNKDLCMLNREGRVRGEKFGLKAERKELG